MRFFMMNEWKVLVCRTLVVCTVALGSAVVWAGEVPIDLKEVAMGATKQTPVVITLNGISFESIHTCSELPYLAWPVMEPGDRPKLPRTGDNPDAVGKWLERCAKELGYEGFEPRFLEKFRWHRNTVWSYELVRNGLVLHDARVNVHWGKEGFIGIQNHVRGRILSIEDPDQTKVGKKDCVYYPVRERWGEFKVVTALVEREILDDRTIERIKPIGDDDGYFETTEFPSPTHATPPPDPVFTEYQVPVGTFPDQISVDEKGIVWFSQPNNNYITSFDPNNEDFTQYDTTVGGGSGPDGLIVGTQGRIWSGMYYSGSLGLYDTTSGEMHDYPASYGGAYMAIPVETTDGRVWVTDHIANRISEFDPVTETWLQSIVMPTPACWVVQGYEDTDHGDLYFVEYYGDQLGRIPLGGSEVTDIPVPGGGPAFCVYSHGKVYYSRWNESGIGVYDVDSGLVTEYDFPVANEWGGPVWLRPNGDVVIGTRNRGYIMVFHRLRETFSVLEIPTAYSGMKDGITVNALDDVIWFTESGANKICKLVYEW